MEEGALLVADVHESSLNPGKNRLHLPEVDVSDYPAVIGPINQELDKPVVL